MKLDTKRLTLSAMFLALCIVLPYLTGNNYTLGNMLLLMHIPVLLCGFACGWQWGLAVGFIAPLLRHLLIGAPPISTAVPMAFELAAYGFFTGLLYNWLEASKFKLFQSVPEAAKPMVNIYAALIPSMLLGRIIWGIAKYLYVSLFVTDGVFTMALFIEGAFVTAIIGIIIQIILIPIIVMALRQFKLLQQ